MIDITTVRKVNGPLGIHFIFIAALDTVLFASDVFVFFLFASDVFVFFLFASDVFVFFLFASDVFVFFLFASDVFVFFLFASDVFVFFLFASDVFVFFLFASDVFVFFLFASDVFVFFLFASDVFAFFLFASDVFVVFTLTKNFTVLLLVNAISVAFIEQLCPVHPRWQKQVPWLVQVPVIVEQLVHFVCRCGFGTHRDPRHTRSSPHGVQSWTMAMKENVEIARDWSWLHLQ